MINVSEKLIEVNLNNRLFWLNLNLLINKNNNRHNKHSSKILKPRISDKKIEGKSELILIVHGNWYMKFETLSWMVTKNNHT